MFAKNIKKLIKNAKLGTFGKNWKYVGNKADAELQDMEADIRSLDGDLYCAACGLPIDTESQKFVKDAHDDWFHKECFGDGE